MTKNIKKSFIFPGQGAQYIGMAKDFFDDFSIARETFEEANEVLGRSLSAIVFAGPQDILTETGNSQPGIFVASTAILRVIQEQLPDLVPDFCAGLSLGEYTALMASERLSFAETLKLVQYRADYMNDACEARKGVMAVVMGLEHDLVEQAVFEMNLPRDLWTANFNCPGQVVISGTPKGVEVAARVLKDKGAKKILPLQVHGAFHSGLMLSAEERLAEKVEMAPIVESQIALAMNVSGALVENLEDLRRHLIQQVTRPVRWERAVRAMADVGVELFIEIGCGKTLAGMNKRMKLGSRTLSVEKLADLELLSKNLEVEA